jgi:hypothetical protein
VKAEAQQPANSRRPWWVEAWPDALAFALGLGLAWWEGWHTTDLVWSLWLSSLCVGYAIIVGTIFRPVFRIVTASSQARTGSAKAPAVGAVIIDALVVGGGLFMLAFFTVHFGGFHYVHSVFLNSFFPIKNTRDFPGLAIYTEVFRRYWPFVIIAAVAERAVLRAPPPAPADTDVTPEAIARRKAQLGSSGVMVAYKGVIRMHLLIFFFAFAHFAHLENFAVYAVVYFVYFFPWRLLRREGLKG